MARFLLLVSPDPPPPAAASPARLGRRATAVVDWLDALRQEERVSFAALVDPHADRVERDDRGDSQHAVVNAIRLCFVIDAPDRDAILGIARSCPLATPGSIDVLPLETWSESRPAAAGACP